MMAVSAVKELVAVLVADISDAKIELRELARLNNLFTATELNIYALRTKTDGIELLANTKEPGMTIAFGIKQGCGLTLIANDFLGEHVAAGFQAVGRQGSECQPTLSLTEAPVVVLWVVIPLPLQGELRG